MKKISALLLVLGGSVALATANAAPAFHAHAPALNAPILKVADQSNSANTSSAQADQDLAQATQDQTDAAAAGPGDQADNSDFDNNDDANNGDDN